MEVEDCILVVAFFTAFIGSFGLERIDVKLALLFTNAVLLEVSLDARRIKAAFLTLLNTRYIILVTTIVIEINVIFNFDWCLLSLFMIRRYPEIFKLIDLTDIALKLQRFLNGDKLVLTKEFWMHQITKCQLAHIKCDLCIVVTESVDGYKDNEEHRKKQIRINKLCNQEKVRFDTMSEQIKKISFLHILLIIHIFFSRQ